MSTKEKIKEEVVVLEKEVNQHHIVLHNDEKCYSPYMMMFV